MKNGLLLENDELIFYKDNIPFHAGLIEVDGAKYYIGENGRAVRGTKHYIHTGMANDLLPHGEYIFGEDGKLIGAVPKKEGLFTENGRLVYYKNGHHSHAGLVKIEDAIYYVGSHGVVQTGEHSVHGSMTNDILEKGRYIFGEDGKLVGKAEDRDGLVPEKGKLAYYKDGHHHHAGVIKIDGDIYYIGSHGYAKKGQQIVHGEMGNGILKSGTYRFGDDYKLIDGSYIAPKKKKKKKKKKKNDRLVPFLAGVAVFVLLVLAIFWVFGGELHFPWSDNGRVIASGDAEEKEIVLPTFEEEVLLCSPAAKSVYDGEMTVLEAVASGTPYRPFVFEYQLVNTDGLLTLSEYSDLHDGKMYVLSAKEKSLTIDNLKPGMTYYYTVTVGEETFRGSFRTAESTRFINLPDVKNTRDIGGYTNRDGKKVKYGMLIRGTEIDGLVEPTYFLTKDSIPVAKDSFGFVCDLDLREATLFNGSYKSRLGEDVKHRFYNSPMYGSIFSLAFQPYLKQIISDLADPANYPMYLHCTYGADRTGTICFLLEGILNLPEEVMQRDYQLTGFFSRGYASSSNFNSIYGGLNGYEGADIQEKIVNYLTSPEVGVTMQQIESIRSIFLED